MILQKGIGFGTLNFYGVAQCIIPLILKDI